MSPPNITNAYLYSGQPKPVLPEQASERAAEALSKDQAPGLEPSLAKKIESGDYDPKSNLNKAIIESQLSVSVSAKDKPLALLFQTVLDGLREYVDPLLGDNAIEEAYKSGLDVSPEATADRIVSLSTAFLNDRHEVDFHITPNDII